MQKLVYTYPNIKISDELLGKELSFLRFIVIITEMENLRDNHNKPHTQTQLEDQHRETIYVTRAGKSFTCLSSSISGIRSVRAGEFT